MRKVKFMIVGKEYKGYFVGIVGTNEGMTERCLLLVEDLEGNIYTVFNDDVKFTTKPINLAPVKRLDLRLMKNALNSVKNYTIQDLIQLVDEKNIIIEETTDPN